MQCGLRTTDATTRTHGEWVITRTGLLDRPLTVKVQLGGNGVMSRDFAPLPESITIPAGSASVRLPLVPLASAADDRTVVVTLSTGEPDFHVGCPSQSLVVIRR